MEIEKSLKQELAALQHELRRVRDALERNRTRDLESRERQLCENIRLCEHELAVALQSNAARD